MIPCDCLSPAGLWTAQLTNSRSLFHIVLETEVQDPRASGLVSGEGCLLVQRCCLLLMVLSEWQEKSDALETDL